ncbi:MAG TPA: PD-(D/E)XK nuclease family protein [Nannocystis sp.]
MHAIGRDLIESMFRKAGVEAPTGQYDVDVKRQLEHVDIVAEIGAEHLLVIEDKVHSAEHSNQLQIYARAISALYPQRKRAFLFLKTGDQSSYSAVEADLWTTFLRHDLLAVLRRGAGCQNAIHVDFLAMIEAREAAVQRFRTTPVAAWGPGDPAYVGLYLQLQVLLGDGHWRYVPNPSGGFLGFWWHNDGIEGGEIYLQLEEDKLVVKIWVEDGERRGELRGLWSRRVVVGIPGFSRPTRFGNGEYMTVATGGDYRIPGSDGRLDLEATVSRLQTVAAALARLVAAPPAA